MKKVSLVLMDREREAALTELRALGVVHLEKRAVNSEVLSRLADRKAKAETAFGLLRNYIIPETASAKGNSATVSSGDTAALVELVLSNAETRKAERDALASERKERSRIEGFGNFDPLEFAELESHGVDVCLYELSQKAYAALSKDTKVLVLVLSRTKTLVRCMVIGKPLNTSDAFHLKDETPFALPDRALSAIDESILSRQQKLEEMETILGKFAERRDEIQAEISRIAADIEFEMAKVGMDVTEDSPQGLAVAWFSGFVPADDTALVKKAASEHGWALILDDPSDSDAPPSKLKNSAFVRIVQPVFDLLGTVPGYREYDISFSFLVFFSLFFAMIFGDGGYGALLFILSVFFGLKSKAKSGKVPDALLLLGLLSFSTIVWGAITGTWFALPFDTLPGFLKALVIPPFYPNPDLDPKEAAKLVQQNIKHLCFIIGTVQLVLAHAKNIKKAFPSLTAFAQLGWLSMVLGLYFLVLNLVLDKTQFPIPAYSTWMIGIGLGLYFIFAEQKGGNFFKNILASFGNFLPTFLSAVSSFSDIISYIRLFAVGLAGFAIAESFNGMAAALPSGAVRIIAGGLILFFGHGLNLAMSALSVVVHGVRLNMLEYSGHLGMEWSGVKYAPFALRNEARR